MWHQAQARQNRSDALTASVSTTAQQQGARRAPAQVHADGGKHADAGAAAHHRLQLPPVPDCAVRSRHHPYSTLASSPVVHGSLAQSCVTLTTVSHGVKLSIRPFTHRAYNFACRGAWHITIELSPGNRLTIMLSGHPGWCP